MKPDQVLENLKKLGIVRNAITLQRYAKDGLVPKPTITNLGRGGGKISEYPETTPQEFYASWHLRTAMGVPAPKVAEIRKLALRAKGEAKPNKDNNEKLANLWLRHKNWASLHYGDAI